MHAVFVLCLLAGSIFWPFGAEVLPGDTLIIVNKRTNELALVDRGQIVLASKVATGARNELTPEGLFTIKVKAVNPYYRKKNIPGEIRVIRLVPAGLDLMHGVRTVEPMVCMVQTILLQLEGMCPKAVFVCGVNRLKSYTKRCKPEQKFGSFIPTNQWNSLLAKAGQYKSQGLPRCRPCFSLEHE